MSTMTKPTDQEVIVIKALMMAGTEGVSTRAEELLPANACLEGVSYAFRSC
jgi:hypothetical protein